VNIPGKGKYLLAGGFRAVIVRLKNLGGQWVWQGGIEDHYTGAIMITSTWHPDGTHAAHPMYSVVAKWSERAAEKLRAAKR